MRWITVLIATLFAAAAMLLLAGPVWANGAVCPAGQVKWEEGGGYEYTDGSATVSGDEDSVTVAVSPGYTLLGICIKIGGQGGGELLFFDDPGTYGPFEHGISHVVVYTEPQNGEPDCEVDCDPPPPPPCVLGDLRIFVSHPDGTPIEGVTVVYDGWLFLTTDVNGLALVEFVPAGTHVIEVRDWEEMGLYFSVPVKQLTIEDKCEDHAIVMYDPLPPMDGWMMTALFFAGGYLLIVAGTWVWIISGWRSRGRTYSAIRRRNPSPRRRMPITFPRRTR